MQYEIGYMFDKLFECVVNSKIFYNHVLSLKVLLKCVNFNHFKIKSGEKNQWNFMLKI